MKHEFEIIGNDRDCVIIVETALGSTFVEWLPIVTPLSDKYTILLYNRCGYGKSDLCDDDRTPNIISNKLHDIVCSELPNKKYILIGHSLGGLFIEQYIRNYPNNVVGAVFLDPATTNEHLFTDNLSKREYRKSGIDKSNMIKWGFLLGKIGLLNLFKPLFRKSIPFYYYPNYSEQYGTRILSHLTQFKTYHSMKREYAAFQNQEEIKTDLIKNEFPNIPVRVLYHNSEIMINEIINFGGLNEAEATKVENLWRKIIEEHYSAISVDYKMEVSSCSGHYIHLTDTELLYKQINELYGS